MPAAGQYIDQSDVEDRFGVSTVAQWSNLEEADNDVVESRVQTAIDFAEEYVESKLRGGPYVVPFSGASRMLVDWCAVHAGVWLYSNRGASSNTPEDADRFNGMAINADLQMGMVMDGRLKLPLARSRGPDMPVVVK